MFYPLVTRLSHSWIWVIQYDISLSGYHDGLPIGYRITSFNKSYNMTYELVHLYNWKNGICREMAFMGHNSIIDIWVKLGKRVMYRGLIWI